MKKLTAVLLAVLMLVSSMSMMSVSAEDVINNYPGYAGTSYYVANFENGTIPVISSEKDEAIEFNHYDVGANGVAYNRVESATDNFYPNATAERPLGYVGSGTPFYYPGTWANYTVNVTEPGTYAMKGYGLVTGGNETFFVKVNGVSVTENDIKSINTTGGGSNDYPIATLELKEGINVITFGTNTQVQHEFYGHYFKLVKASFLDTYTGTSAYGTPPRVSATEAPIIEFQWYDNGGAGVACGTGNADGAPDANGTTDRPLAPNAGSSYVNFEKAGRWANYTVDVAEAGVYVMRGYGMYISPNETYYVKVNGENVSSYTGIESENGSVKALSGNEYCNGYPFATLNLKEGKNVITFGTATNANTGFYVYYFQLEKVNKNTAYWYNNTITTTADYYLSAMRFDAGGEYDADTNPYGGYYTSGNAANMYRAEADSFETYPLNASMIFMNGGDWINFTVNTETAGWYDVVATKWADVAPNFAIHVDGAKQLDAATQTGSQTANLGQIYLPAGESVIRVSGHSDYVIWQDIKLSYSADQTKPLPVELSIINGDGTEAEAVVSGINASLVAPGVESGVIILAIYENNVLKTVKSKSFTRSESISNGELWLPVTLDEAVTFDAVEGKTYTAKAFLWDDLTELKPSIGVTEL